MAIPSQMIKGNVPTLVYTYLSLSVNSDDARAGFVGGGDENGVARDAIHVDASARLEVVQVDVAVLGDQVHDVVLW